MSDNDHAYFAPSFSDTWIRCNGALSLCHDLHKQGKIDLNETTVYMEQGTWAHEIAAECLRRKITPLNLIGKEFKGEVITAEDARQLNIYYRLCEERMNKPRTKYFIETRVHATDDVWGTADFFSFDSQTVEVIDLKWGKGVVKEVVDNFQEMIYAYAVVKKLQKAGVDIKNIILWIVQPRIPNLPVKKWEVSFEYLYKWISDHMLNAVLRQKAGDRTITPGPEQCRFCPAAKRGCNRSNEVAHQFFEEFVVRDQDPRILPIEKVIYVLNNEEMILKGIKNIRKYAESVLMKGGEIPGYTMKNGRSNRQWTDEPTVEKLLKPHIPESELFSKKMISIAGVESVLGKKHPLMEHINKYVTKPEGKPKLSKDDGSGKKVATIQQHFQNLIENKGE